MLRVTLLLLGWLLYLLSLCLPSVKVGGPAGTLSGFQAAVGSFYYLPSAVLAPNSLSLYLALLSACNLLMALSPVTVLLVAKWWAAQKAAFAVAALSATLYQVFAASVGAGELLAGYYVWAISFVLIAVAVNVGG